MTAAAQGIGKATAELFAREGATVYAADINEGWASTNSMVYPPTNIKCYRSPVLLQHWHRKLGHWEYTV